MNDIIRFIPFWWKTLGDDGKFIAVLLFLVVTIGTASLIGGLKGFMIMIVMYLSSFLLWGLWKFVSMIYKNISYAWQRYKDLRDYERDEIVNRLRR